MQLAVIHFLGNAAKVGRPSPSEVLRESTDPTSSLVFHFPSHSHYLIVINSTSASYPSEAPGKLRPLLQPKQRKLFEAYLRLRSLSSVLPGLDSPTRSAHSAPPTHEVPVREISRHSLDIRLHVLRPSCWRLSHRLRHHISQ